MHGPSVAVGALVGAAAAWFVGALLAAYRFDRRHYPSYDVYRGWNY